MKIKFPHLVEQWRITETLIRAFKSHRLPHAFLFLGQDGVGKEAAALDLARVILCSKANAESGAIDFELPCEQCPDCVQSANLKHPNLKILFPLPKPKAGKEDEETINYTAAQEKAFEELLAAKAKEYYTPLHLWGGQEILLEHIRSLRHEFSLTSFNSRWRVVIISQADRLRLEAANAFLKLLEEPPPSVVFLLTSSRESRVLPTIFSRCQILRFHPIPADRLKEQLQRRLSISSEPALISSRLANGSWWSARQWAEENAVAEMEKAVVLMRLLVSGEPGVLEVEIDKLSAASSSDQLTKLLTLLSSWLREVQRYDADPSHYADLAQYPSMKKFAAYCSGAHYDTAIAAVEEARLDLERNVLPALVLHRLFDNLQTILFNQGTSVLFR